MIQNEFVIQYGYPCNGSEHAEFHWDDEHSQGKYVFEPEDEVARDLALGAAKTYAAYCDYLESGDEHPIVHRVVHRITSDLVV